MFLHIGKSEKIIVEKQGANPKANYGERLKKELSAKLTKDFGKRFNERNLQHMRRFCQLFKKRTQCVRN